MSNLVLDFYKGSDKYSDGDVEDFFLQSLDEGLSDEEILEKRPNDWATYYHFSDKRWNLLRPLSFEGKSVLEIGGGCGAITGYLLNHAKELSVIELSKRRSQIIQARYKEAKNLDIYVGAAQDVEFSKKFDVVTLIGVLEYAGVIFPDEGEPQKRLLNFVKNKLNESGELVLAIENALGMKYFAGAPEDHTGKLFDGITDYQNTKIKTFGRNELKDLLMSSGFDEVEFYYPYPDYKFCDVIFTDEMLPRLGQINREFSPNFDAPRYNLFSEKRFAEKLIKNGIIEHFMNSFLVVAKKKNL
jgi:hypothetical protein